MCQALFNPWSGSSLGRLKNWGTTADFPGGPVGRTPHFCCRIIVWPLVRELRSHMLLGVVQKKKRLRNREVSYLVQGHTARKTEFSQHLPGMFDLSVRVLIVIWSLSPLPLRCEHGGSRWEVHYHLCGLFLPLFLQDEGSGCGGETDWKGTGAQEWGGWEPGNHTGVYLG